jgi:hypothetical protein
MHECVAGRNQKDFSRTSPRPEAVTPPSAGAMLMRDSGEHDLRRRE